MLILDLESHLGKLFTAQLCFIHYKALKDNLFPNIISTHTAKARKCKKMNLSQYQSFCCIYDAMPHINIISV